MIHENFQFRGVQWGYGSPEYPIPCDSDNILIPLGKALHHRWCLTNYSVSEKGLYQVVH